MATTAHDLNENSDPTDCRRDVDIDLPGDFLLDSGETLSVPVLRVRLEGPEALPVVFVAGGISASRVVADTKTEKGWWPDVVKPDGGVDLDKFQVLSCNFLPNPDERARTISTRDQARAVALALDALKIEKLYAYVGSSFGGMVGLCFAADYPERLKKLCVISAADRAHPMTTALRGVQRRMIEFSIAEGKPEEGLSLARQLAMTTYRTSEEFGERFTSAPIGGEAGGRYDVCEYLVSRGESYKSQTTAERYITMSDAMDRHRVNARAITADTLLVAAASDRLVPAEDIRRMSQKISGPVQYAPFPTRYGHDAFLKEAAVITGLLKTFLEETNE